MKKIIKRFWGVAFTLVLLSTLLIGAVPQAAAGNFVLSDSWMTPGNVLDTSTTMRPAAGFGILDVAQSGATLYATGDAAGVEYLYKSIDGGATWVQAARGAAGFNRGLPSDGLGLAVFGPSTWGLVAVAPDNPDIVVVVNTENVSVGDTVYLSLDGGALFQQLPGITANITCVAISPQLGLARYIAVGGSQNASAPIAQLGYLRQWTLGAVAPAWTAPTNFANLRVDGVHALAYSPNFAADQSLLVVTEDVGTSVDPDQNGAIALHVYRYDIADWDQNVDSSFPRYLVRTAGAELVMGSADIVLDANFYMGDAASQIGFIGANITGNVTVAGAQLGGVFRMSTYTPVLVAGSTNNTLTQIDTGIAINSVAWDGTNLMAAVQGVPAAANLGLVVRYSATALSPFPMFLPNTGIKTPGTGNATIVLFNASAGVGYAFSRGNNSAVCRTTDYGKTFNAFALINSTFFAAAVRDMWASGDAATKYFTVGDGVDLNVWRQSGFTWERVAILPGATAQNWTVSADADNSANVFIARVGATTLYKSTDSGDNWVIRTASFNIQDIAVQDDETIYVAVQGQPWILKGSGPLTTWTTLVVGFSAGGGNVYSINLLADDQLLVGGTAGGIAYSTDGGTTWTGMTNVTVPGNVIATASGLATGDAVYAVSNGGGNLYRWILGVDVFFYQTGVVIAAGGANGIALSNGVLYVLNPRSTNATFHRLLQPAVDVTGNATTPGTGTQSWDNLNGASWVTATGGGVNNLHATAAGTTTTLYAIDLATFTTSFDPINTFVDYLTSPANAPIPTYPLAGNKISVNSINGAVAGFVFKWNSPPVVIPFVNQAYNYNVEVYLDEAGLVPIAGSPIGAQLGVNSIAPDLSLPSGAFVVGGQVTGAGGVAVPGETYYWRVRTDMGAPVESYWSDMQTFTVEQLVAVVPVVSSPENGGSVDTENPAFSWSPIAGATSYSFELATDVDFTDVIYSATPTSAGAAVPATMSLNRGQTYYWRVKALTPAEGEWSTVANFMVAELPPEQAPPVVVTEAPTPTIVIEQPAATTTTVVIPPDTEEVVNPSYIWAIIIIGAVLVIAVIVLIVRTRRTV